VPSLNAIWIRAKSALRNRRLRARCFPLVASLVAGKSGIEVGGPSGAFRSPFGVLPVYPLVGQLDNCNFGARTVWQGTVADGSAFVFDNRRPAGRVHVSEASDLSPIASARCDFVLSSHVLEHCANTLKALGEQVRILKDGGTLVVMLPHGEETFDRLRPVTTLGHIREDARAAVGEDDMTHFDEIVAHHDFSLDPRAGTREQFEARSRKNHENRCFHHHVFDTRLVLDLIDEVGLQLIALEALAPFDILAVARKLPAGHRSDNTAFHAPDASWRRTSVFSRDRIG
jgi:SAM-dependent methyltransferase